MFKMKQRKYKLEFFRNNKPWVIEDLKVLLNRKKVVLAKKDNLKSNAV